MAECGLKLVLLIFLFIDIAVIIAVIGIFGWKLDTHKDNLEDCQRLKKQGTLGQYFYDAAECDKLVGLIVVYCLLFIVMAAALVTGFLIVCCCENVCCAILFLILNIGALVISICLLALYHDFGNEKHKNANIAIGAVTLIMNLALVIMSTILIAAQCGAGGGIRN